jgi:hypothetical protein
MADTPKPQTASDGAPAQVDELVDRYSSCLNTGGDLRERVEGLREEWRGSFVAQTRSASRLAESSAGDHGHARRRRR